MKLTDDFYNKKKPDGDEHNPMSEPRFSEIATFMRAPLVESLDEVDIGYLRYGNGRSSDYRLFENNSPIIKRLAADLIIIM